MCLKKLTISKKSTEYSEFVGLLIPLGIFHFSPLFSSKNKTIKNTQRYFNHTHKLNTNFQPAFSFPTVHLDVPRS